MVFNERFQEKFQAFRSYIEENKILAVSLSLLVIFFSTGLIYMALQDADAVPADSQPTFPVEENEVPAETAPPDNALHDHDQVEVLPQLERMETEGKLQPFDPFAAPPQLVGVLAGGGEAIAIIEAGGNTYIVKTGELVAGLWKVTEIQRDQAVIVLEETETVLQLGR